MSSLLGDNGWQIDAFAKNKAGRHLRSRTESTNTSINMSELARMLSSSASVATTSLQHQPQFMLNFVASDNEMAAKQMGELTGYPFNLISPKGCHVEIDQSEDCHTFTATQWFILSQSNIISTQTLEYNDAPSSSFSRYAGIYGLKYDPFRNGRVCSQSKTNKELHLLGQSNWFC